MSPLELLARRYLLALDMVQHLFLAQIIPPLLLLGLPLGAVTRVRRYRLGRALDTLLSQPLLAWTLGLSMLWLWHAPRLYGLAQQHTALRNLQHTTVLLAALAFWWPIFSPRPAARVGTLGGIIYLASACFASSVLGIIITFAPASLYPAYLSPRDPYGVLPVIRYVCNLSPQTDQRLGGLLMWLPCCLLYLTAIMGVFTRWFAAPDDDARLPQPEVLQ